MSRRLLLEKFHAKARCSHTQRVAYRHWVELLPALTYEEKTRLSIAWGHHVDVGEGPEELDDVCNRILAEWSQ